MEATVPVVNPVFMSKIRPDVLTDEEAVTLNTLPEVRASAEMVITLPVLKASAFKFNKDPVVTMFDAERILKASPVVLSALKAMPSPVVIPLNEKEAPIPAPVLVV